MNYNPYFLYLSLLLCLGLNPINLFSQETKLAGVNIYQTTRGETNKDSPIYSELQHQDIQAFFKYPHLLKNKKDYLVAGLDYTHLNLNGKKYGGKSEVNKLDKISLSLAFIQKRKWTNIFAVVPHVSMHNDEYTFGISAAYFRSKEISNQSTIGFGGAITDKFGFFEFVPLFEYLHERAKTAFYIEIPDKMVYSYKINKSIQMGLGTYLHDNSYQFNKTIAGTNKKLTRYSFYDIGLGPEVKYQLNEYILLETRGLYNVGNLKSIELGDEQDLKNGKPTYGIYVGLYLTAPKK